MSKVLTVKNVAELFRKVPQYATNRPKLIESRGTGHHRSVKPASVKKLCAEMRADGKSYARIARDLRARRIRIDRETVSKILQEPEIVAAIEGEYEAGLERIREATRQRFAEQARAEQQRWEERRRRWEVQAAKDRKRARERYRRLKGKHSIS